MVTNKKASASVPELRETALVDVTRLKIDVENPRLLGIDGIDTDAAIIAKLYSSEDLRELLRSIAANGYMDVEPLIVCLDESDGKLVVLEGNRRLAAIRLFLEEDLVAEIASKERLKIDVPEISDKHLKTLSDISVYRVEKREDARQFIGFKHINGPAKWTSYAKAMFALSWYESGKGTISLEEVAERIGDGHDTVKRMVVAIYVLNQAKDEKVFDIIDRKNDKFHFSHLYTALARPSYMKFLGLEMSWAELEPKPNLVSKDKLECLGEMLIWIYGSKEQNLDPLIRTQNPDLKNLGDVIANAEGLHILRAKKSLSEALRTIIPAERSFSDSLVYAKDHLNEAAANMKGYDGKDASLMSVADDILETAETVVQRMRKKRRGTKGKSHDQED